MSIDLNCDMGELDDAAREEALMRHITSANIACGAHAGDPALMESTARLALRHGVRIGAHPGYPDRANFGRLELALAPGEIRRTVREQIEALERIVAPLGGAVLYVKPHGALYNSAARGGIIARAIGEAVAQWKPGAAVYGLAGSPALDMWREMGLRATAEGFADRRYEPDGSLRSRKLPGALISDPEEAAGQAVRLAREGRVETICIHGDAENAPAVAQAVAQALSAEGFL